MVTVNVLSPGVAMAAAAAVAAYSASQQYAGEIRLWLLYLAVFFAFVTIVIELIHWGRRKDEIALERAKVGSKENKAKMRGKEVFDFELEED